MANPNGTARDLIEGRPALVVIDIQASTFVHQEVRAIDHMPDYADRMAKAKVAIDAAREQGIPVIFIQEVHRPDLIDFGRELDGDEDVHCLEDHPNTAIAAEQTGFLPTDIHIRKRRYSAFFGTDFEIMLRRLDGSDFWASLSARLISYQDDDVIVYCRIGERSSHSWFVLKYLLGYPKVANYDGSWTEWGNLVGQQIETGGL